MPRRPASLEELLQTTRRAQPLRTPAQAHASVRILGVDPGSRFTGWGVIEARGMALAHVAHGCIRTGDAPLHERLKRIHQDLTAAITSHAPQEYAVEEVFMRVNVGSALVLGQARGVAVLAGAQAGLPFAEYAPAQVKRALVGTGRAEKAQIQHMVRILLKLQGELNADAADALAIAICHAHVRGTIAQGTQGHWG